MSVSLDSFRAASSGVKTLYITVGIFALALLIILTSWASHTQTVIKATTHQPETYTELFFTNPNSLPQSVASGQMLPVNFTVHNVEARSMTYTYDIAITLPSGQQMILDHKQLSVADGKTQKVGQTISLPQQTGRYEITIAIENQPDAIHYWTEKVS